MKSLRAHLPGIGLSGTFGFRRSLAPPRPRSLRALLQACTDPRMAEATRHVSWPVEHGDYRENAQGIAHDEHAFYIVCNADDRREGVHRIPFGGTDATFLRTPFDEDAVHLGSPVIHQGWIYIPTQTPFGLWKVSTDFRRQVILRPPIDFEADLFAWCAINPNNGLLYTCNFDDPAVLRSYDARAESSGTLPSGNADIPLVHSKLTPTTKVQAAAFTANYRVLMISDLHQNEAVHCHSALTGAFMGRCPLLVDHPFANWVRNELEGLLIANVVAQDGVLTHVQVLELENDWPSTDEWVLWGLRFPAPELL